MLDHVARHGAWIEVPHRATTLHEVAEILGAAQKTLFGNRRWSGKRDGSELGHGKGLV
jgi:hypothetical protein